MAGVLVTLVLSTGASATTVAQYEAAASLSVSLTSARFESSGAEAWDALSIGRWEDGSDTAGYSQGAGDYTWDGSGQQPGGPAVQQFSRSLTASGHAGSQTPHAASGIGDYYLPALGYGLDCTFGAPDSCTDMDNLVIELAYSLETSVTTDVFDPVRGTADAWASTFLGIEYFSDVGASGFWGARFPGAGNWDFQATTSGNQLVSGILRFTLEAGSVLGLNLSALNTGGSASYTDVQIVSTPVPPAVSLMLSGFLFLGWVARRSKRRGAL